MEWYLEGGGSYVLDGKRIWKRNIILKPTEIDNIRCRFNNIDPCTTVYCYYGNSQDDSYLYGPFYIDIDLKLEHEFEYLKVRRDLNMVITALNVHYKVPIEYMKIYFSGSKGFHLLVPPEIFGIGPDKELNEKYKFIAQDIKTKTLFNTVDMQMYDRKRLLRLPNSINSKSGLYKVPVDYDFIRTSSFEDIKTYASMPHILNYPEPKLINSAAEKFAEAVNKGKTKQEELMKSKWDISIKNVEELPCVKKIMANGTDEGSRNKTGVALASSLIQSGHSIESSIEVLDKWNANNSPMLDDGEIKKFVESAYKEMAKGIKWGCASYRELGYCQPNICKRMARKIR